MPAEPLKATRSTRASETAPRPAHTMRRLRKRLKWLYRPAIALVLRVLKACLAVIPRRLALEFGELLGQMAYAVMGKARREALKNLTIARIGCSAAERGRIARECFKCFGKSLIETLRLPAMSTDELRSIVRADDFAPVERVLARGRGLIVLSAHIGAWEVLAAYLALRLGRPFHAMGARIHYGPYDELLVGIRRASGVETVYRDGGARESLHLLRENKPLGILADQDIPSSDGVFVEFLGRPSWTPTGPAALARASGAGMVPIMITWEGLFHRVHVLEEIDIVRTADRRSDLIENTQRWSRAVESVIVARPEQWAWFHRRWRTVPKSPSAKETGPTGKQAP